MNIGLAAWIIQDGNYGEFESGRTYRFALEFSPVDLRPLGEAAKPLLVPRDGAQHEACGTIVRVTDSNWVVDFGIPTFQDAKPPTWATVGLGVQGEVYIGIDPFFYFERLKDEPGMPDLFRDWQVRRILIETTPWTLSANGRVVSRAPVPRTFKEVQKTDAWHDDGGHGEYILDCLPGVAG
jgi:hypothetical protein